MEACFLYWSWCWPLAIACDIEVTPPLAYLNPQMSDWTSAEGHVEVGDVDSQCLEQSLKFQASLWVGHHLQTRSNQPKCIHFQGSPSDWWPCLPQWRSETSPRPMQKQDPVLGIVIDHLENDTVSPATTQWRKFPLKSYQQIRSQLVLHDGILCLSHADVI